MRVLVCALAGYSLLSALVGLFGPLVLTHFKTFFPPGELRDETWFWVLAHYAAPAAAALGAVVFGLIADRGGCNRAVAWSFAIAGLTAVGFAAAPSYAAVGGIATDFYALLRVLFNFAAGGAFGAVFVLVFEAAPRARRGLWLAVALMLSGFAGVILMLSLNFAVALWEPVPFGNGWRLEYLPGVLLFPLAWFAARTGAADGAVAHAPADGMAALKAAAAAAIFFGVVAFDNLLQDVAYTPLYEKAPNTASVGGVLAVAGLLSAVAGLAGGWLSDRHGRRPVMIASAGLLFAAAASVVWRLIPLDTLTVVTLALAVPAAAGSLLQGALYPALAETLPGRWRATGLGLARPLAVAVNSFFFTERGGEELTNGELMLQILLAAAGLAAVLALTETAPARAQTRDTT